MIIRGNANVNLVARERDAVISHGATRFLQERLFDCSDKYAINVCKKCGQIATTPMECRACETDEIVVTKAPFIFKLCKQELAAMLIKMKLETE